MAAKNPDREAQEAAILSPPFDDYLTAIEARKRLGISHATLRRYAAQGHIGTWGLPDLPVMYSKLDVARLLREAVRPATNLPRETAAAR